MKKKIVSLVLTTVLVLALLPFSAGAVETSSREEIEYLSDGSYIITTIEESVSRASGNKVGTRTKAKYDSNDNLDWEIVLRGVFNYTGTTSSCTASTISVNTYDSAYSKDSSSATRSGNTAYGTATIIQKVLGVTISKDTYNLTLSCDKDGNLS